MANFELCRLCLNYTPVHYSLLKSEYGEILAALTEIQVTDTPEATTEVCVKCLLNLKLAHRIQQRFIEADERLRSGEPLNKERPVVHDFVEIEMDDNDRYSPELSIIKESQYKCEHCSKTFREKRPLIAHLKAKHQDKELKLRKKRRSFKCRFCDMQFKSRFELGAHKHDIVPCPVCNKKLRTPGLNRHIKVQHGTKNRVKICDLCGGAFMNVNKHKLQQHNDNRTLLKCEECGKTFKRRENLKYHRQRDHTGDAPQLVCEACGKIFYSKEALQKHVENKHEKTKTHICHVCSKDFSSRFALKTHLRQHTNETPYMCEECGDGFKHNVSLKAHKRSRHGLMEQEVVHCKVCGKGFSSSHGLKVHERLHM